MCTGALISKALQGIAVLGAVKKVKDKRKKK
jgi:hypothetical protein